MDAGLCLLGKSLGFLGFGGVQKDRVGQVGLRLVQREDWLLVAARRKRDDVDRRVDLQLECQELVSTGLRPAWVCI